jgi:hypothetical protein
MGRCRVCLITHIEREADIAKVHEWLGNANIATTRIDDRRETRPEDSLTCKVAHYPAPTDLAAAHRLIKIRRVVKYKQ